MGAARGAGAGQSPAAGTDARTITSGFTRSAPSMARYGAMPKSGWYNRTLVASRSPEGSVVAARVRRTAVHGASRHRSA